MQKIVRKLHPVCRKHEHCRLYSTKVQERRKRLAIVGGGAAGLMCTVFAQSTANALGSNVDIYLIERKEKCGRKILMSGGSRCNVLPHESKWPIGAADEDHSLGNRFFSQQPDVLKEILRSWSIEDQKTFFEEALGIGLSLEHESGKYFPESNDAKQILDCFMKQIYNQTKRSAHQTRVLTNTNVHSMELISERKGEAKKWKLGFTQDTKSDVLNSEMEFDQVVIASGGLSVINKDGTGLQLLSQLGHKIVPLYPALTPLLSRHDYKPLHKELAGISVGKVKITTVSLQESGELFKHETLFQSNEGQGFLFTHRGYSGPSVLNASHSTIVNRDIGQLTIQHDKQTSATVTDELAIEKLMYPSSKIQSNLNIELNWTPDISINEWKEKLLYGKKVSGKQLVKNFIHKMSQTNIPSNMLPLRLIQLILENKDGNHGDLTLAELTPATIDAIAGQIVSYRIPVSGSEGLKKAEVTGGGVDLSEINPSTLESYVQPNLHICGEALDAFGCIGGFNFAFAWISGRLAGISAITKLTE